MVGMLLHHYGSMHRLSNAGDGGGTDELQITSIPQIADGGRSKTGSFGQLLVGPIVDLHQLFADTDNAVARSHVALHQHSSDHMGTRVRPRLNVALGRTFVSFL